MGQPYGNPITKGYEVLFEKMREFGVKRVVLLSTISVSSPKDGFSLARESLVAGIRLVGNSAWAGELISPFPLQWIILISLPTSLPMAIPIHRCSSNRRPRIQRNRSWGASHNPRPGACPHQRRGRDAQSQLYRRPTLRLDASEGGSGCILRAGGGVPRVE